MIWPDIDFFDANKKRKIKEFMILFLVKAKQLQDIV